MKKYILTIFLLTGFIMLRAQQILSADPDFRHWQVGIGLGELPVGGSLKPSLTFGYHFNNRLYAGIIYQFKDNISRNGSSFNADATGLDGLIGSRENVGQRFMIQGRYTPVKWAPYISFGIVFNDTDIETMNFSYRNHGIGQNTYHTTVRVVQTRKKGWSPAVGIGYQFDSKKGISVNAEWTPGWFVWIPEPDITVSTSDVIAATDLRQFRDKIISDYKSHVTNLYKVFHIGISYRF